MLGTSFEGLQKSIRTTVCFIYLQAIPAHHTTQASEGEKYLIKFLKKKNHTT